MGIKLDLQNRRNITVVGGALLVLVLLFQFIYFPKSRQVERMESEYRGLTREIDELYNFVGGRENLKDNIIRARNELALLEKAFPSEKEVSGIIKGLNKEAERFKVSVRSLKPQNLYIYRDAERELKFSGYFCKCMPLVLKVESRYQALGEFLASLEASRAPLITIEEVEIQRDKDIMPDVKAEIELKAFILGK